jgi:hypothetical protein
MVGHTAHTGEMQIKSYLQNLKDREHFRVLGIDLRVVLKWI